MIAATRTILDPPRHPIVQAALGRARQWCEGQIVDDAPALQHAVRVARALLTYVPDAPPVQVAAALLHDAPEFAPASVDLDRLLDAEVGSGVARIVRALAAEHAGMDRGVMPDVTDLPVLELSAADKVVAFDALRRRARRSGDEAAFWAKRRALRVLLPYFDRWRQVTAPRLPVELSRGLWTATDALLHAMGTVLLSESSQTGVMSDP